MGAGYSRTVPNVRAILNTRVTANRNRYDEQWYNILCLTTTGAVTKFLLRCKLGSTGKPNSEDAWDGFTAKQQNFSKQRRRVLMWLLESITVRQEPDPHVFMNQVYQL